MPLKSTILALNPTSYWPLDDAPGSPFCVDAMGLKNACLPASGVNEMWGTDMTQTITIREGRANVFVAVEHANSEVVGIHASRSANRFEALEPVRQGVHRCFGAIAPGVARGSADIVIKLHERIRIIAEA
jgi:hypothetical protein